MAEPRVSVVVPSYNHAPYLETALRSVLDSELEAGMGLELLVVDDGSRDASPQILERLAAADARLRFWGQENQGAHAALNRALSLAQGEIVCILNSDDVFAPTRIAELVARFDANPRLALAGSWLTILDTEGATLGVKEAWRNLPPWPRPRPGPSLADLGDPVLALLESNYLATTSNVALRRSLIGGLEFRALRYAHDWDFFLGACGRGDLEVLERPLLGYRVHPTNTIKEGQDAGKALMRFEILWLLARHAWTLTQRAVAEGRLATEELEMRLWHSLPAFGESDLLLQLLALRGRGPTPPPAFEALAAPDHPFTRAALERLRAADGE